MSGRLGFQNTEKQTNFKMFSGRNPVDGICDPSLQFKMLCQSLSILQYLITAPLREVDASYF